MKTSSVTNKGNVHWKLKAKKVEELIMADDRSLQFRIERGPYQAGREVIFLRGNLKLFKELSFGADTKLLFYFM